MKTVTTEEELNLRNLTDKQYAIIVEQFIGRHGSIEAILRDLNVTEPVDLIETELWLGGFKRCPCCGIWHEDLWHSACFTCRAWRRAYKRARLNFRPSTNPYRSIRDEQEQCY